MQGLTQWWVQGDVVSRTVGIVLLLMSVSVWVLILWKGWMLTRAHRDLRRGVQVFWAAPDWASATQSLQQLDREQVLLPLLEAARQEAGAGTLGAQAEAHAHLTRRLRDSLHGVLVRLQSGQVLLASVGAVAPFVGLLGTVWGIYHAMIGISTEGTVSLDQVAGPVGEALIMTAAGLAVAIPAVLAYNVFGKRISAAEVDLEGFAHDLREMRRGGA